MKKRLIIVDVSSFIFRAFFAIRLLHAPDGTPINAVHGVMNMLLKLFSKYRPTHLFIAKDSPGPSFRHEMYDEYKANRSEPPEDLVPQFALIKTLIEKMELPYLAHDNFEADDIIGSACVQWADDFDEILIASGDKDLMQFVNDKVKMVDTMKDKIYDPEAVFEKMGVRPDQIVDFLSIVGDKSDNIPGMKGIGVKGAAQLLAEHGTLEECIEKKDTFKGKKLTNAFENHLDEALLSKKLVQIVTDIDLGRKPDDLKYKFYPSDGLIDYLKGLGFKSSVQKLEDLKRAEFHAEENDNGGAHLNSLPKGLEFSVKAIQDKAGLKQLFKKLEGVTAVAIQMEYNNIDPISKDLVSFSISLDGKEGFYIPFKQSEGFNFGPEELKSLISVTWENESLEIISENVKRDLAWLFAHDYKVYAPHFDIIQAHYVFNTGSKHEISFMAQEYFGFDLPTLDKKNPFVTDLPIEEAAAYAGQRACIALKLADWLKKELKSADLEKVYYDIDDALIPVLAKVESHGVMINKEFFDDLEYEYGQKLKALEDKIFSFNDGEALNLNSPKQVGEFLFEKLELPIIKKTKTGYSTDSAVLVELASRDISPVPDLISQYRELGKLLSTYVKTLPTLVNEKTNRIHTTYNQNVAATGRLSSTNPNLQNIPIRTELGRKIRKGFIAEPGKLLLGADYSQVELRLLAHFSGDPVMVNAFLNNQDIHKQTAAEIMGVPLNQVTSEERSKAKAVNFGLMYGQSSFGLANQLRIKRKEAKEYITRYFERFSSVKQYLDSLKESCERTGYAITMYGRKRNLPDIHSSNRTMKAMAERVAINSPIQGTAADIIKLAMIKINDEMEAKKLKSKMILQVHDELIFEVPEEELDIMQKLVKDGMENIVNLEIPLRVDMGVGVNWYDLK